MGHNDCGLLFRVRLRMARALGRMARFVDPRPGVDDIRLGMSTRQRQRVIAAMLTAVHE